MKPDDHGPATRTSPHSADKPARVNIGVMGGMGALAAFDSMEKMLGQATQFSKDKGVNVHVTVDQATDVPDRTASLLKGNPPASE